MKFVLCPAASVTGAVIPLRVKPVPLIATCEIVTDEPPLLVRVSARGWLVPVCTVPKFKLDGFGDNPPAVTPVPVSGTVTELSVALLVMASVPVKAPAVFGENTRLTGVVWPASIAIGTFGVASAKDWLENEALLTVTEADPVFVAFTVRVLLLPVVTEPKSTLDAPSDKVPAPVCEFDLLVLTPAQPSIIPRQATTIANWLIRFTFKEPAVRKNFIGLSGTTRAECIPCHRCYKASLGLKPF